MKNTVINKFFISAVAAVMMVTMVSSARGATKEMVLGTFLAKEHPINAKFFPAWGEAIKKATNGEVVLRMDWYQGKHRHLPNLVRERKYDVSWGPLYGGNEFPLTSVGDVLSFLNVTNVAESVAMWRTFDKYLRDNKELEGLEMVGFGATGGDTLHTVEPINSIQDLKGTTIRAGSKFFHALAKEVGFTVKVTPFDTSLTVLERGGYRGVAFTLASGLPEILDKSKYTYSPGGSGFSNTFVDIYMSKKFLASLDEETRKAVLSTTGEKLGLSVSLVAEGVIASMVKKGKEVGHEFNSFSDKDLAVMKRIAEKVDQDWIDYANSQGYNGKEIVDFYRKIAASYKSSF